ncbi:nucleotidyltransferase family protein [Propioniciclava soli]|uniref:nucleotidyltransferase family protein n=1 Tax=Propioniciclava soli TaxID=2775081 RepID=UPI001E61E833|nr:nucleotidyltransferase domain-containing protein [Propioniciclava soli]
MWSVQQALADFVSLGLLESTTVGRANLYTVNEAHYTVGALRALLEPLGTLREIAAASGADSVVLFGSVARGEATASSDIDLAVIAEESWDGRAELEDSVRAQLGNDCDVVVFTPHRFAQLAASGDEPVVEQIMADGVALVGSLPRPGSQVA